jgi:hypothetical protein
MRLDIPQPGRDRACETGFSESGAARSQFPGGGLIRTWRDRMILGQVKGIVGLVSKLVMYIVCFPENVLGGREGEAIDTLKVQ